ncbi:MAG: 23S rRNA (guanine745-N1)-methyltransferase [Halieaceae bacterium]
MPAIFVTGEVLTWNGLFAPYDCTPQAALKYHDANQKQLSVVPLLNWICPHCQQPLLADLTPGSMGCENGHRFDRAKEGYVNLLPANSKRAVEPGDSKKMIAARRRVLDAETYQPLASAIGCTVGELSSVNTALDLGCGEGYYSAALHVAMPEASVVGVDISKVAVRLAARRCQQLEFAVASAFDVPLATGAVDLLLSVFAPHADDELTRLLPPGAYYLKVTPGPRHLWGLRELLYDQPRAHEPNAGPPAGFRAPVSELVEYKVEVRDQLLKDLVAMTPFAHKGHRDRRAVLENLRSLDLELSFRLDLYQRL